MRLHGVLAGILRLLTLPSASASGQNLEARDLGLIDLPPCGIQCMISMIPSSGCALDDVACVCGDQRLGETLAACVLANCTMADAQRTARVRANMCNLSEESKSTSVFVYTGIVYSVAFIFVMLRIAGKILSQRVTLDDYIVVCAVLLATAPLGCVIAMTRLGFGEHIWNLEDGALLHILRFFYICSSTYVIVLGLIKISLILFYLEIFKTRRFQFTAYIVLTYIAVSSVVIFLMTIFSCSPVSSFWDRDIKGKCMDIQALAYANSASAILQDFILLILPLVFIRNLQMKRYRKLAVGFMFVIGTFGCIATVIRLQALYTFRLSLDPTWEYVPITIWTELELAAGFVCVSLPSIRIFVVRMLPVRLQNFLSNITHSSNRSIATPKVPTPPPPKEWREPTSWMNVSQDPTENIVESKQRKSFLGSLWSQDPRSQFSLHTRSGSRRLNSAMSNYSDSGVAVTRPPYREEWREPEHAPVELLNLPQPSEKQSARESCKSCEGLGDDVTALPTIGCLPERTFSNLDLAGMQRASEYKRSRDHHV